MSYADDIFVENCNKILKEGIWDTTGPVRPKWSDGSEAHTKKTFCIVNRYDLQKEFPIMTLRKTAFKNCVDEILWIWQKKSNNIKDLNSHIWDSWADENGSIGKAYGYQLGVKHQYKEGMFDQVDRVLYDLKNNPLSRRIMTNIYTFQDLHEMNLYPCAYSMTFNVTGNKLNAILNQKVNEVYSSEKLAQIIITVVEAWADKPDAEDIAVILNSESLKQLEDTILAGVKEKMLNGVTLKAGDNFDGGFRISVKDGSAYYDYSSEAVVEMLSNYLSPKVTELLREA